MKATVATANLQKKLSFVHHAISSRAQLPILSNILIEVTGETISFSGTDLEIGIKTTLPALSTQEGGTTVPAKTFFELISSLTEESITIESTDTVLTVTTRKTTSVFQTISEEEFPKLYEEKGSRVAILEGKHLKEDFASVLFSASTDASRPALSGILLKKLENGFTLVATDGYRLSLRNAKALKSDQKAGEEVMLVPSRVFREILSLKDEAATIDVFIAPDKNQVLFESGSSLLVGRLLDATFPNYQKIIPTDTSSTITFDREDLLKAVRICSIFAREAANIIKLSLTKTQLVVSSQTPSVGENTVTVEGKLVGEENEIAFNAKYLLDVLSHVDEEEMYFEMTGPLNPGVFKVKSDPSFLHLIMPIRIQQ